MDETCDAANRIRFFITVLISRCGIKDQIRVTVSKIKRG